MIGLGAHAEFIVAAYIGVFIGVTGLITWTVLSARASKRRLRELGDSRADA